MLLPLWDSVIVLRFVVRYFISILVLQSSFWGRESWLLCLICLPGVSWWLDGSSSRCHGVVCGLWLWYFLIILTYFFISKLNLSCAKDFRNLNSMVTWCINWRRLMALIIFQRSSIKQFPIIKRLAITLMLQQTACLVVNPITVGNFASSLIARQVGTTLDSMMVLT